MRTVTILAPLIFIACGDTGPTPCDVVAERERELAATRVLEAEYERPVGLARAWADSILRRAREFDAAYKRVPSYMDQQARRSFLRERMNAGTPIDKAMDTADMIDRRNAERRAVLAAEHEAAMREYQVALAAVRRRGEALEPRRLLTEQAEVRLRVAEEAALGHPCTARR